MAEVSKIPGAMSRSDLRPAGRLMREDKSPQKRQTRDREAAESDQPVERLKIRGEVQHGRPDQGRENHKESEGQKRECTHENVGDGLRWDKRHCHILPKGPDLN
jgi:hypothetical protein